MGNISSYNILVFLFLFTGVKFLNAQKPVEGYILDSQNKEPLPYVNIIFNDNNEGTTSDMSGYFKIPAKKDPQYLKIIYMGYEEKKIPLPENDKTLQIKLNKKAYKIDEVKVLPGKNPAHRIIRNAIENKDKHKTTDLKSYKCKMHVKYHFTIGVDSLKESLKRDSEGNIIDTTDKAGLVKFFEKNHIMFLESIIRKEYIKPGKTEKEVLANRLSGITTPFHGIISTDNENFSLYNEKVKSGRGEYISPLCDKGTEKYFFLIEDSVFLQNKDTSFVISFEPKRGTNFKGLKGIFSVRSDDWSIHNVRYRYVNDKGSMETNVRFKYNKPDGKHWFPEKILMDFNFIDDNDAETDSAGSEDLNFKGGGKFLFDSVEINNLHNKDIKKGEKVSFSDSVSFRDSSWWENNRLNPLTKKEEKTYIVIDSIGKKHNFDRIIQTFDFSEGLIIPVKIFDIKLNDLMDYNEYEGFRFGFGVSTNERLSKFFDIGGFTAYSIRNDKFKYGGKFSVQPLKNDRLSLNAGWYHDTKFAGQVFFEDDALMNENYRRFFIDQMDWYDTWYASVDINPFRGFYVNAYLNKNDIDITNLYRFNKAASKNHLNEWQTGLELNWKINEKIISMPGGNIISRGTDYPELFFNIRKGFPHKTSDVNYWRFETRVTDVIKTEWFGNFHLTFDGGWLINNNNGFLQNFYMPGSGKWLDSDNSFATMRPHEFAADRYGAVFFKYDMKSLLFSLDNWKPEIAFSTNVCLGNYKYEDNLSLNTANSSNSSAIAPVKGYIESGIQLNSLIRSSFVKIGAGFYYNYGPYSGNNFKDNYAVKLRIEYNIFNM